MQYAPAMGVPTVELIQEEYVQAIVPVSVCPMHYI